MQNILSALVDNVISEVFSILFAIDVSNPVQIIYGILIQKVKTIVFVFDSANKTLFQILNSQFLISKIVVVGSNVVQYVLII